MFETVSKERVFEQKSGKKEKNSLAWKWDTLKGILDKVFYWFQCYRLRKTREV
jgi:hypothetical protein